MADACAGVPEESIAHVAVIAVTALCAVSLAVTGLRVWVRLGLLGLELGLDDWFMILAVVMNIAETVLICITTRYGLGQHTCYVVHLLPDFFKLAYATILIYLVLIWAIKSSLIFFYRRLSPSKYFHHWCWAYLAVNFAIFATAMVANVIACRPIPYFWDRSIPGGTCFNLGQLYLANGITFIIMDILALLLPLGAVFNLRMPTRKKLELAGIFGLGLFVCVASFVRITTLFGFNDETDPTWVTVNSHIWSMVEINVGIVTVCIPTIKPFYTLIVRPAIFGPDPPPHSKYGTDHSHPRSRPPVGVSAHITAERSKGGSSGMRSHGESRMGKGDITLTTQHFIEHEMNGFQRMGGTESEEELDRHGRGPVRGHVGNRSRSDSATTSERELR